MAAAAAALGLTCACQVGDYTFSSSGFVYRVYNATISPGPIVQISSVILTLVRIGKSITLADGHSIQGFLV